MFKKLLLSLSLVMFCGLTTAESLSVAEFEDRSESPKKCKALQTYYRYKVRSIQIPIDKGGREVFQNFLNEIGLKGWHLDSSFPYKTQDGKKYGNFMFSQSLQKCAVKK